MKKIAVFLLLLMPHFSFAQLNVPEKGFTLDLGVGLTAPKILNNVYVARPSQSLATLTHFNINYKNGLMCFGVTFESVKYFSGSEDTSVRFVSAKGGLLQFNTRYTFMQKKKSAAYVVTGIGVGALNYERRETNGNIGKIRMEGFSANFGLGMDIHFRPGFGIFFKLGYAYSSFYLTSFSVNANDYDEFENRPLDEVIFAFRGLDAKTGLRFGLFKKEQPKQTSSTF